MKMRSKMKIDHILFALALTPCIALPAGAGEQQVQSGGEMVVTASRMEQQSIDVPITTQVITRDQIEMSGARDVGDLIGKYITGHFHKFNGLLSPVGLRGFRSDSHGSDLNGYVLILIDGHRTGTGNAAKINLDRIERVEVVKGPSSALYGSAAMGGVINLITKTGDGPLGGSITGEYGSFDYYKGQVSTGGEVSDTFRFFITASIDEIGDYSDPTFGTVYNSGIERKEIGGNVVYTFSDRHEVRLGGNYSDLYSESPSWRNWITYSAHDPNARQNSDKSIGYADLEYNGEFLDGKLHWKALAYYLYDKNHWFWGFPDPDSSQTKYIDKTIGTDHQFTWRMTSWNTLLVGFTIESLEKESSGTENFQPSTPLTPGLDYDNQALFIQDSMDLFDNRVNLIAAARYDRFDVTTKRAKTGTYADFNERSETYDRISPKFGIGVKFLDEMLRVRANIGDGFKSPTADQLSADYVDVRSGVRFLGNPDLDPETSRTFDIGFDVYHSDLSLTVSYFHTDWKDKIVRESLVNNGQGITTYTNHGDATIAGFEIGAEWILGQTFNLPFDASLWSNMAFNTEKEDEQTGEDLLYISDYEVKSGLNLGYAGVRAQLSHVLVGSQMITNFDTFMNEEKGTFSFWDLTVRYRFAGSWEINGSILNLFDQEVEWARGYIMPERNYRIGLTWNF
ncbi:TonB-dependent receptor plug domain-containing protein [Desulfobulbus alkaliphilus]|uniref:TonB-dependent receptor plug domain-containing protein n=1 Tax=Desulfobulbus alkaliphilus TaxID=869814 RepID=UPI0019655B77|nr:TonB-dependent receptor [Desulfobulbus alkaliphilus]MBM9538443.1 TonB-dependent receptor [Desulfobulbus alkaliphilus]